jgi:hypothetical protein
LVNSHWGVCVATKWSTLPLVVRLGVLNAPISSSGLSVGSTVVSIYFNGYLDFFDICEIYLIDICWGADVPYFGVLMSHIGGANVPWII